MNLNWKISAKTIGQTPFLQLSSDNFSGSKRDSIQSKVLI